MFAPDNYMSQLNSQHIAFWLEIFVKYDFKNCNMLLLAWGWLALFAYFSNMKSLQLERQDKRGKSSTLVWYPKLCFGWLIICVHKDSIFANHNLDLVLLLQKITLSYSRATSCSLNSFSRCFDRGGGGSHNLLWALELSMSEYMPSVTMQAWGISHEFLSDEITQ